MNLQHGGPGGGGGGGGALKINGQVSSAMCPHKWTGRLQTCSPVKTKMFNGGKLKIILEFSVPIVVYL